jgi:maleate isomerase
MAGLARPLPRIDAQVTGPDMARYRKMKQKRMADTLSFGGIKARREMRDEIGEGHFPESTTETIFVSCMATKALDVADDIEAASGLPCVTSSQVTFWHPMRLAD